MLQRVCLKKFAFPTPKDGVSYMVLKQMKTHFGLSYWHCIAIMREQAM
jgi:hypothetical protein